jgi:flagellar basal-body rod protein FlgG
MIDSLYIATTGLHVGQSQIDTISNNLANINTASYKKARVSFEDLMYKQPVGSVSDFSLLDSSMKQGAGSGIAKIAKSFESGDLRATENDMDIAIRGNGFIEVELENGMLAYTRNGSLQLSSDGFMQTSDGHALAGHIQIPPDTTKISIDEQGIVSVRTTDDLEFYEVGQIQLANFFNVQGLEPVGGNIYMPTSDSGNAYYSNSGEDGMGEIQQGFIESSNVDLVQELVDLMVAQRGYQVNSQVIQASDEIMKINNSLRR